MALPIVAAIAAVLLDQIVKYWAAHAVRAAGSMPGIRGLFQFVYVENRGAAFSSFQGMRAFLIVMTFIAIGALLWAVKKGLISGRLGKCSVYMILAGAVGNLIDRIRLGYVVDMIDLTFMRFAVFNVADCFVCVGTALFAWYMLRTPNAFSAEREKESGLPLSSGGEEAKKGETAAPPASLSASPDKRNAAEKPPEEEEAEG